MNKESWSRKGSSSASYLTLFCCVFLENKIRSSTKGGYTPISSGNSLGIR